MIPGGPLLPGQYGGACRNRNTFEGPGFILESQACDFIFTSIDGREDRHWKGNRVKGMILASLVGLTLMAFPAGQQQKPEQQEKKPAEEGKREDEPEAPPLSKQGFPTPKQHSVLLLGDVTFEDGTPVPDVPVTIHCAGGLSETVYSQTTGEFSFFLVSGQIPPVQGYSASAQNRDLSESLGTCTVSAQLYGFDSNRLQFSAWGSQRRVGTIVLYRRGEGSGMVVSLTTLAAPEAAVKAYSDAKRQLEKQNPDYSRVERELQEAVDLFPDFASAWYLMGICRTHQAKHSDAVKAYLKAVEVDPDYLSPYLKIAESLLLQGEMVGSADWAVRAIEKSPDLIEAHYIRAFASYYQGNIQTARESILRVRESSEAAKYPGTYFLLGALHATNGALELAAAEFRKFLEVSPESPNAEDVRRQLTEWEEQGLIENPAP